MCAFCLQVYELTLHYTQHQDHNVVTGALELLQQLFRTPPPELLQALTIAGGLAQLPATRERPGCRSRSGSIVELIGEWAGSDSCSQPCRSASYPQWSYRPAPCQQLTSQIPTANNAGSGRILGAQNKCRKVRWQNEVSSGSAASTWGKYFQDLSSLSLCQTWDLQVLLGIFDPFCSQILFAVPTARSYSGHLLCLVCALLCALGFGP